VKTTLPLICGDEVWVFAQYDGIPGVDVFRLGFDPASRCYCTFPPELFHTDGLLPVSRHTGEPFRAFRWATVADLDRHPLPLVTD
jgi:hypothetical protein